MIVDARICYEFTYIKRGGRKPRTVMVEDRVPVLIREIDEAPVYITCRNGDGNRDLTWREAEGKLYLQRSRSRPVPGAARSPVDMGAKRHDIEQVMGNPLDELSIREILEDGREAAVAQVQSRASRHIATPDALLIESAGPFFTAPSNNQDPSHHVMAHDAFHGEGFTGTGDWRRTLPWGAVSLGDLPKLEEYLECKGLVMENSLDTAKWPKDLLAPSIAGDVIVDQARFFGTHFRGLSIHDYPMELVKAHLEYTHPGFDKENAHPRLIELLETAIVQAPLIGEVSFVKGTYRGQLLVAAERARIALDINGYRPVASPRPFPMR